MSGKKGQYPHQAISRRRGASLNFRQTLISVKTLRIILIVILTLMLVPTVLRLVKILIVLVNDLGSGATHASYLIGLFIGTLLIGALLGWLIAYLWKKNKAEVLPPRVR